jgi:hypothetical protein
MDISDRARQLRRQAVLAVVRLPLLLAGAWGVLALAWFDDAAIGLRTAAALAFGFAALVAVIAVGSARWRLRAVAGFALLFLLLLVRWQAIEPRNDRDWRLEGAVLADASVEGPLVTVHNIRNFDYRTESDFTPGYYDRTFDLRQLAGVDLVAVYWMGPAIAHVFLSFAFEDGKHLAVSIEARKERSEEYSTLAGFFRQYELQYVVADERDVIRLRTNYRHAPPEDVYVYRLVGDRDEARRLFLSYIEKINALAAHPEFYNSLTTNCTNNIWLHAHVNPGRVPYSWRILASGYLPEYLYDADRLDRSVPFATLQWRSRINEVAHRADAQADFSRFIRARLPLEEEERWNR